MIVRPAQSKDIPAIIEIVERCGLGVEGLDYSEWSGVLLVAVRQSEVVGFINALPAKPYAVITEMGVLPEHQKGRAARMLIDGMDLLLRHLGCRAWAGYVGDKRDMSEMLTKRGAECVASGGSTWIRRL